MFKIPSWMGYHRPFYSHYRPGSGIARQYSNAVAAKGAGIIAAMGWGANSIGTLAYAVSEKSTRGGIAALLFSIWAKLGFDTYKTAKQTMKNLEPEYEKIVDRAMERADKIKAQNKNVGGNSIKVLLKRAKQKALGGLSK